jgi:hypothetical protein
LQAVARENPDDEHWKNGVVMCTRWLTIQEAPSQEAVDEFLARLSVEPNPGSGRIDLGIQFRHWAQSHGFRA